MRDIKAYLRLLTNIELLTSLISWKAIIIRQETFYELLRDTPLKETAPPYNTLSESDKISIGIIKYLLHNEFNTLEKIYKDKEASTIFIAPINLQGAYERGFIYTKSDFIRRIETAYQNNLITEEEYAKTINLRKDASYEKMLENYKDKNAIFQIGDKEQIIPFSSFISFLSLPLEEMKKILKSEKIAGLKKEEYILALNNYFDDNCLLKKYVFPYDMLVNKAYIEKTIDTYAYDVDLYPLPEYTEEINVNEELWQEIWSKVPSEFTDLEKAYYIYYQLCKALTYDEEWYVLSGEVSSSSEHKDISYLKRVNKEINEVVCFEFNAIYSKFLESLGARYEYPNHFNYAEGHEYLRFIVDKFYISVDSTESIIYGDMPSAKQNKKLSGFKLKNTNKYTKDEFENSINKVNEYIKLEAEQEAKFLRLVEEYKDSNNNIRSNLSDEERLNILISSLECCTLPAIDSLGYIQTLVKNLFPQELNCTCKNFFIRDNNPPEIRKKNIGVSVVIYYNSNSSFSEEAEKDKYFIFTPLVGISIITKEELEEKMHNHHYQAISQDYPMIPGINYEGGADNVTKSAGNHK